MRQYLEYLTIKYKHIDHDCYGLVRLFYLKEFGIELTEEQYKENWHEDCERLILDSYSKVGFSKIESAPKYGDILLFNIGGIPRHLGIYLGDSTFIHTTSSVTARHSLIGTAWGQKLHSVFRYKIGEFDASKYR